MTSNQWATLVSRKYVPWDAAGVEKIPPHEEEDMKAVIAQINEMQQRQYNKTRHCYGGTHARTQGIVKGRFVVPGDLPSHLKQSELFKEAGEYPVACRYSSEPGDPGLDDRIPQPRGFAMKIFNVNGEMFDAGQDYPTQDIEFNSTPAIELADTKTTREILDIRLMCGGDERELRDQLKKRSDYELQVSRDQVPNKHLESMRWYSQSAYRFGNYVMKYRLVPSTETQRKLAEETVKPENSDDILHLWLQNFHTTHDAEFLFEVQLLENLEEQPVEYAGTIWDEKKYPWQPVAELVIHKQDSWSYSRKAFWEDHIRLDPWHGLIALQPLGSSNRLRRVLYPASSALRRKMNARQEINIKTIGEIPG
ncbi:catalase-like domain-containing protein [Hypoxylon trugodes]|uniref:catalase-like domain-containing protein n=1 Tax=Hypoxylon trugodes TaxID=326681 RepID=UPI00219843F3|nr:catalase-like domain-containing protein [Hypoxylon trugodes]KAI1390101.1 catalase-like domain-containing protein [Hypoxylon trugodes]